MRSGEAKSSAKGASVYPYGNNQASPERIISLRLKKLGGVADTQRVAVVEGFQKGVPL